MIKPLFDGFAGNDGIKSRLSNMITEDKFPHAVIFEGESGLGKRTLAMMTADALCGGDSRFNPDVKTVLPDGQSIKVSAIRDIRQDAYIMPNQSPKKCYIIPDASLMNESAQNAILKVLEEPPSYVVFILTCEHAHLLLSTVVSRAAVFSLSGVDEQSACNVLLKLRPDAERESIMRAAKLCGGNIGRALSLLDDDGEAGRIVVDIVNNIDAKSELSLIKALVPIEKDRQLRTNVIKQLTRAFSDAICISFGGKSEDETALNLSQKLSSAKLMSVYNVLSNADKTLSYNINATLFLSDFCACIRVACGL